MSLGDSLLYQMIFSKDSIRNLLDVHIYLSK